MITEIAAASGELLKLINKGVTKTTQERIDALEKQAREDVTTFKEALLCGDLVRVNYMLGGLQHGFTIRLGNAELERLGGVTPSLNGISLLSLFARARYADFTSAVAECVRLYGQSPAAVE